MKSSIIMPTSNYPLKYLVFILLLTGYYVQSQGTGSIEATNYYPCAGNNQPVVYLFVTSPGYTYTLQEFSFHNVTPGVDYALGQSRPGFVSVKWLKPSTTAYITIAYAQRDLSGNTVSYTAIMQIDVRPQAPPLPYTSKTITFTEFQPVILSVPESPYTLDWYDANNASLGAANQINLGCKSVGIFHARAKAIDNGCEISGIKEIDFEVVVNDASNDELNWLESIAYDGNEEIVSHSKAFVDLTGGILQLQSRLLSADKIMTSQTVEDKFGRQSIFSLSAPVLEPQFTFKNRFIRNLSGSKYSFSDSGSAVDNSIPGTVGWYYSSNNTLESFVPATAYPYTAVDYYEDGTGQIRFQSGAGEVLRIGAGHEKVSGTFPVVSELDDYLARRAIAIPGGIQDGSLTYEAVQKISRDNNHHYTVRILDKEGHIVMTAQAGTSSSYSLRCTNVVNSNNIDPVHADFKRQAYFYLTEPQAIQFSGDSSVMVENLLTGNVCTNISNVPKDAGHYWLPGFYRIYGGTSWSVTYTTYFKNVAYAFYNDAGKLISEVSPNGYEAWKSVSDPAIKYNETVKTTHRYNFKGLPVETTEVDAGTTTYQYCKDGKVRFSQNAQQAIDHHFSYINYDPLGRPIEFGEYVGSQYDYDSLDGQLETWQAAYSERKDWVMTGYDYANENFSSATGLGALYQQEFLRLKVSWTRNANIQTWYSYDELGRVMWMAQKPKVIPRVFVAKYKYDLLGNVLMVSNLSYDLNGVLLEQFYHHYQYDADKRLSKAYTSLTETGPKKIRATYTYYLHGPLKRIELGDHLQGIDFVYNIQGWLTQINHPDAAQDPGGDSNDVFGMVLDYYESDMLNLFLSTENLSHDPLHFDSAVADMSEKPEASFKIYSAENPVYKKMLQSQEQNTIN